MDGPGGDRPELALHQLHAFAVLAEELHFGRAAERLGIAQPPLSQQIRRLERKVGHPLFDRGPGGVALTPAGHGLLPAARRALGEIAGGLDAARRAGRGEAGRIRIGFAASLALTVLPRILGAYHDRYPGVEMEVREMTTAPQVAALCDGSLDVGLMREPPETDGLVAEPLLSEGFVAVLPAGHPLAARRAVPVAALADEPFVLLPRAAAPTVHDRIAGLCRAAGFEPRAGQRAVEWQTVCALVGAGLGVSLAPASVRRIRSAGVAYRRISPGGARTTVAACHRAEDAANPLVAGFLRTARDQTSAPDGPARPLRQKPDITSV
ncbi:LysR family transcriptional regulator [Nonomuraea roseoviolacea]|uniref:DNA-binding transcriptional LysR family regulator n=1 Tax=Nonomuraea roseoviolacea subsp. carminata TaxID=160689 RepID=A0ABT1JRK8_9ACTN|nr:LysR family transcriptional regulator [Nonomuraea roseoviolacea]MCP2344370.1 DNA-binding transcriptional LysR family regulator [Nonomuraea roseoviolacea subsp. carminata]